MLLLSIIDTIIISCIYQVCLFPHLTVFEIFNLFVVKKNCIIEINGKNFDKSLKSSSASYGRLTGD